MRWPNRIPRRPPDGPDSRARHARGAVAKLAKAKQKMLDFTLGAACLAAVLRRQVWLNDFGKLYASAPFPRCSCSTSRATSSRPTPGAKGRARSDRLLHFNPGVVGPGVTRPARAFLIPSAYSDRAESR